MTKEITDAYSIAHYEVQSKVLDKVGRVEGERATVERMKHGMTSAIGSTGTTIRLATLPELQRLTTKSSLIYLPIFSS